MVKAAAKVAIVALMVVMLSWYGHDRAAPCRTREMVLAMLVINSSYSNLLSNFPIISLLSPFLSTKWTKIKHLDLYVICSEAFPPKQSCFFFFLLFFFFFFF